MRYTFNKPIIADGDIIGYEMLSEDNSIKKVRISDIATLISKGLVKAKIAIDDDGKKHIYFSDELINMDDKSEKITVEGRIIHGGTLIGYICKNTSGKTIRVKPDKLWEYTFDGKVTNMEAHIINNKRAIFGKGISIKDLKVVDT